METVGKRRTVKLGVRIVLIFLVAFSALVFAAFFVLSSNFQNMLTDYTIKLVQAMVEQGVTTIEYELRISQKEVTALASFFSSSASEGQTVFPKLFAQPHVLRLVYVSEAGSATSDGRRRDLRGRQDIAEALSGKTAVYGPYYNEENEYVVCYSAPVYQDGKIVGAAGIEKDGYRFSSLIGNIRFVDSGESYIINAEGTDIAVSNQDHIAWVKERYNARRILETGEDAVTRSILELEKKGLAGETGVGTYYWDDGLCYVVYAPIPSVNWVLLAGMREEEISSMTRTALYGSLSNGPILAFCVVVFLLLTGVIVFWIISSLMKSAEINEKLNILANYDTLTGTMNRNSYHAALDRFSEGGDRPFACVYLDVNGLHEVNNHLGHQAGDKMLKAVAEALRRFFSEDEVYRIGGDEFVVLCRDREKQEVRRKMKLVREDLERQRYDISFGIEWNEGGLDVKAMVNQAEDAMQREKRRYYQENGKERQIRRLDEELEQMVLEKQDADTFLSVLAPEFKGVYFVNLGNDTIRHLYIPPYFEEMLKEEGDIFSKALLLYARRVVAPEYRETFNRFCDYEALEAQLGESATPEFIYQKMDGSWIKLRILKFKTYTARHRETLWIFSNKDNMGVAF